MKKSLTIVKLGGKLIDDPNLLNKVLQKFSQIQGAKILVHGGAKKANKICEQMGIKPQMVEGRRITDKATLEVVTMVYSGLINKGIVSTLSSLGCTAIGLSGPDADIIRASKRPKGDIDYGFAGDIIRINKVFLMDMIDKGYAPVICPITHDGMGQLLNTNADTIANKVGQVLTDHFSVILKYCFEFEGVLKQMETEKATYKSLDRNKVMYMKSNAILTGGIIPKLDNALEAVDSGITKVLICGVENLLSETNATTIC